MRLEGTVQRRRLRLKAPLRTAHGALDAREVLLLRLFDGPLEGVGEASPLREFGTEDCDAAEQALLAAIPCLGAGPVEVAGLGPLLEQVLPRRYPAARAALECALLDLLGQRMHLPLRALLADDALDQVEVSALLGSEAPAEDAARAVAEGARTVKLKVAALPLAEDVARARAVRDALGGRASLRLDANGGWTAEEAARALAELAPLGVELCEQPVAPGQPGAWSALARLCPLAADESCRDPAELSALLEARALKAVVLKLPALGGMLPALRLAALARAAGAEPLVTSALDGAVGRAAAAQLAAALRCTLPSGLSTGALFVEDLCPDTLAPFGGRIALGPRPGLGLAVPSRG